MATRVRHVQDVVRLGLHALRNGASLKRPRVLSWDASQGCEKPVTVTFEGRSPAWGWDVHQRNAPAVSCWIGDGMDGDVLWIDMMTKCRRCEVCLRRRSRLWTYRAKNEIAAAPRTWFGTITLRPEDHVIMAARATVRLGSEGTRFARLSASEQFAQRVREVNTELTLWLKRIRKESAAKLRYILVAEAHKSGLPHWHVLLHEAHGSVPVPKRTLDSQWTLGFTQFRLVAEGDEKAAWYVCKYLSKSAMSRVRASQFYGNHDLTDHSPATGGRE